MRRSDVTIIILTYNESIHIRRAIKNVIDWCDEVIVLDSYSTDDTAKIAEASGAKVYFRKFDNYAAQRNYAIHELPVTNDWIFFLDADEYLSEGLKKEVTEILSTDHGQSGFYIKRKFVFMNKWIRRGGYYPLWILRLFNRKVAKVDREMNEHVMVEGSTGYLRHVFFDHNLKSLSDWIEKHNRYSTYEAEELFKYRQRQETKGIDAMAKFSGSPTERKRWLREHVWNPLPPFLRPFLYFIYRYFFRLGLLDGKAGFIYHYLHGFWYPLLTDIKYEQIKKNRTEE